MSTSPGKSIGVRKDGVLAIQGQGDKRHIVCRRLQISTLCEGHGSGEGHIGNLTRQMLEDLGSIKVLVFVRCFYLRPEVAGSDEVESFGPVLGTCTSDSVKKSGLGWPSLRLSNA